MAAWQPCIQKVFRGVFSTSATALTNKFLRGVDASNCLMKKNISVKGKVKKLKLCYCKFVRKNNSALPLPPSIDDQLPAYPVAAPLSFDDSELICPGGYQNDLSSNERFCKMRPIQYLSNPNSGTMFYPTH